MSNLILHRGGVACTLDELQGVATPPATKSYTPVGHYKLAMSLQAIARDHLPGYSLHSEKYGLARGGAQLFGVHTYRNGSSELGLSIGFRNSLDKSLSVGLVFGASVFVCDNLALQGNILVMRKHTINVWQDLEHLIVTSVLKARTSFYQSRQEAEAMKGIPINDKLAWEALGVLYGNNILTTRQLPVALKEWHNPTYPAFQPRTLWSFYNACTEALKSSPPHSVMERHLALHQQFLPAIGEVIS